MNVFALADTPAHSLQATSEMSFKEPAALVMLAQACCLTHLLVIVLVVFLSNHNP